MNTFPQAVFLMLLAASASASGTISSEEEVRLFGSETFIGLENNKCLGQGNGSPNASNGDSTHKGVRFAFRNLSGDDGGMQCTDKRNNIYSFGMFRNVKDFQVCADRCTREGPIELINAGAFRGIDFDCNRNECHCLYDQEKFHTGYGRSFDSAVYENGSGPVNESGGRSRRGFYCGRIVNSFAADEFLQAEVVDTGRALRGSAEN